MKIYKGMLIRHTSYMSGYRVLYEIVSEIPEDGKGTVTLEAIKIERKAQQPGAWTPGVGSKLLRGKDWVEVAVDSNFYVMSKWQAISPLELLAREA